MVNLRTFKSDKYLKGEIIRGKDIEFAERSVNLAIRMLQCDILSVIIHMMTMAGDGREIISRKLKRIAVEKAMIDATSTREGALMTSIRQEIDTALDVLSRPSALRADVSTPRTNTQRRLGVILNTYDELKGKSREFDEDILLVKMDVPHVHSLSESIIRDIMGSYNKTSQPEYVPLFRLAQWIMGYIMQGDNHGGSLSLRCRHLSKIIFESQKKSSEDQDYRGGEVERIADGFSAFSCALNCILSRTVANNQKKDELIFDLSYLKHLLPSGRFNTRPASPDIIIVGNDQVNDHVAILSILGLNPMPEIDMRTSDGGNRKNDSNKWWREVKALSGQKCRIFITKAIRGPNTLEVVLSDISKSIGKKTDHILVAAVKDDNDLKKIMEMMSKCLSFCISKPDYIVIVGDVTDRPMLCNGICVHYVSTGNQDVFGEIYAYGREKYEDTEMLSYLFSSIIGSMGLKSIDICADQGCIKIASRFIETILDKECFFKQDRGHDVKKLSLLVFALCLAVETERLLETESDGKKSNRWMEIDKWADKIIADYVVNSHSYFFS